MINVKIVSGLYCGDAEYWEAHKDEFDYVIHACKEPYHRMALGYKGRGAPKDSEEYLIAERGNELCLNLIDADDPKYIPLTIMISAVQEIDYQLEQKNKIFVHCNEGKSRAPGIVFMYLMLENIIGKSSYEEAVKKFKDVYPLFEPANGINQFLKETYDLYYLELTSINKAKGEE